MNTPILVTGIHRSGSTWLGEMLSLANGIGYLHEPFNKAHGRCVCGYAVKYWYEEVSPDRAATFRKHFEHLLRFSGHALLSDVKNGKWKKVGVQWRRKQVDLLSSLAGHRPLIKDPLALLSADWIAAEFDAQVVITVRHPAAFVDSLRRKGWTFDFSDLSQQPRLLEGKLSAYAEEIRAAAAKPSDDLEKFSIEDQAILLWKIMHGVIADYRQAHPDWIILRHEDVSRNPFAHFEKLYGQLDLNYTPEIVAELTKFVRPEKETAGRRDSAKNAKRWLSRLTPQLVEHIHRSTAAEAATFYQENDWQPDAN